ncbi:MAG: DUF3592 domain-containing protein [Burkholderiaceae bacterium]|nr:DUF3592 domain-containing protein [Burkholderiaceae bacterium]
MKWMCLLLFGGLGLIIFVIGVGWGYKRLELYNNGVKTTGTVVEITHSTSSDSKGRLSTSYYAIVEFTTPDEKNYKFRGSTGSSAQEYFEGEQVDLIYNPARPSDAQIADFSQFWLGPLGITIFGFVFLVLGVGGFMLISDSDKTFKNPQSKRFSIK